MKSLATDLSLRDVAQAIQYVQSRMFDAIPESGGFNSVRIAELLNFRKALPPAVTVVHVHALLASPTRTEKEISELAKAGTIRRILIPGRGTGGSSIGEAVTLQRDVERLVRESKDVSPDLAEKFIHELRARPVALNVPQDMFTPAERMKLMRSGFVTSLSQLQSTASAFLSPDSADSITLTSIASVSRAASGSIAAVGGEGAVHGAGGHGGIRRNGSQTERQPDNDSQITDIAEDLQLSLPGMGSYLKLLTVARSHLFSLVQKSRFKEIPMYLLRERWDGGVLAQDSAAKAKRYRGEFVGVLPNRTRKWKQFYGLSFDWVIAECLGAGIIEVFETGSVGKAVRVA